MKPEPNARCYCAACHLSWGVFVPPDYYVMLRCPECGREPVSVEEVVA